MAQSQQLLVIDANSFAPVQTDVISRVPIDKIGVDPSQRSCARIKMHINRMTREDIAGISVRPVGGSVVVTKQIVATEGNGLIVEMTAKAPTRFYLHHDKYGDSKEVSLNLEGNKEYKLEAMLNTTFVGKQYFTNNEVEALSLESYNFTTLDLSYTLRKGSQRSVRFGVTIYNLFNQMYCSHGYGYSYMWDGERYDEAFYFPQAPLHALANVTVKF